MANVLSNLAADIYKAADMVGRELVGVINSVTINGGSEAVALNDTVRSHFTRPATVTSITPSMTIPEGTDQTVDNKTMTIDTPASVQIPWTGEDIKHANNGSGFETIYGDQIKQAMRAIVNQIETAIWNAVRKAASRAYGTAGTTPFASGISELAQLRKILEDNGLAWDDMISACVDTTAGANLRSLTQLQKVNEGGSPSLLRQGEIGNLLGFSIKQSAGIGVVTKGTGGSYLSNNASGYVAGATSVAIDTGSGTVLAGDAVTFAGDTNKYVVGTGVAAAGTIVLNDPGLRAALADNVAMTVGNNFTANVALHKSAAEIAIRPMADPPGGDAAVDTMIVQDPWSGLPFEIKAYKGFKKSMFMVSCAYGVKAWKPQHIAILLG